MQQYFDAALQGLFAHLASEMATVKPSDSEYRCEPQKERIDEAGQVAALIMTVSRFLEGGYSIDEFYARLYPYGLTNKTWEWFAKQEHEERQKGQTDSPAQVLSEEPAN